MLNDVTRLSHIDDTGDVRTFQMCFYVILSSCRIKSSQNITDVGKGITGWKKTYGRALRQELEKDPVQCQFALL